jgi:chaperonin GroES
LTNPSRIQPTEFKVLVHPKEVDEKTTGGIIIPEQSKEREQYAQQEGELIAVSPLAFTYQDWPTDNVTGYPRVGDTVLFAKYSGAKVTGMDGVEYRLVNDKDIGAVIEP